MKRVFYRLHIVETLFLIFSENVLKLITPHQLGDRFLKHLLSFRDF